jgi:hypothetical protein
VFQVFANISLGLEVGLIVFHMCSSSQRYRPQRESAWALQSFNIYSGAIHMMLQPAAL